MFSSFTRLLNGEGRNALFAGDVVDNDALLGLMVSPHTNAKGYAAFVISDDLSSPIAAVVTFTIATSSQATLFGAHGFSLRCRSFTFPNV